MRKVSPSPDPKDKNKEVIIISYSVSYQSEVDKGKLTAMSPSLERRRT